jgi:very-short-patch-repair endonuclease
MPKAERILWKMLRELPPEPGLTFRRQHPVHPYILDFACLKIKLAVELDGFSHDNRQAQDHKRDLYLARKGYVTLHFTNDELMTNADGVVETIVRVARKLGRGKALPPWGEGWVGGCRIAGGSRAS